MKKVSRTRGSLTLQRRKTAISLLPEGQAREGIKKTLIGSVAARVIGYSRTDALVVPPEAEIGWSKILFATDGSKFSEEAEAKAIDFAQVRTAAN
ncbi:MAG: hypothetical protein MZV70_44175 [Desulfobacterales bacterium]|nr:hypothetical protein [Desulfobacterales bacterium]